MSRFPGYRLLADTSLVDKFIKEDVAAGGKMLKALFECFDKRDAKNFIEVAETKIVEPMGDEPGEFILCFDLSSDAKTFLYMSVHP